MKVGKIFVIGWAVLFRDEHTPRQRRWSAERLVVEKISPSAECLCKQNSWNNNVGVQHPGEFAAEDVYEVCSRAAEERSVDRKTAFPYLQNFDGIRGEIGKIKKYVVQARADYSRRNNPKSHIIDGFLFNFSALQLGKYKKITEQNPEADYDAVPVDLQGADGKKNRAGRGKHSIIILTVTPIDNMCTVSL